MTWFGEREFWILLLLNALAVVVYLLWCLLLKVVFKRNVKSVWLKALMMLLCPLVGFCFFLAGYLIYRLFFFVAVDLEDVVFSKDRVEPMLPAEEERESNMIPIEEAMAVTDKDNLRNVMLDVVKGQNQSSLSAITMALRSSDSEVAHYAAAAMQSVLNRFHAYVEENYQKAMAEKEDETKEELLARLETAGKLIDYMTGFMEQDMLSEREQARCAGMMDDLSGLLMKEDPARMTPRRFEAVCMQLLKAKAYERCRERCLQAYAAYPEELEAYVCQLKLYYATGDRERFFRVLRELRASDVAIDSGTLEMVRVFQ